MLTTSGLRPRGRVLADRVLGRVHLHHFVRQGDDPFSAASLYRCRCGIVRPGL